MVEPMARGKIRFTRKDLAQLPEDWRAELIEGDLVMLPAPDPSHQMDIVIDDESVLQPDILLLPEGTRPARRPWVIPPPIWVAEVLSPTTAMRDCGVKLTLYARRGVREAWIVDPDRECVVVHDLRAGTDEVCTEHAESRVIAGFRLAVAPYFAILRG